MTEFAPLEYYFAEGKRQWPQTPKLVNSRAFYELWEKVYRLKPFPVGKPFRMAGTVLHLPSAMETLCGHTEWSEVHHCAALIVEGATWSKTFLLRFRDAERGRNYGGQSSQQKRTVKPEYVYGETAEQGAGSPPRLTQR